MQPLLISIQEVMDRLGFTNTVDIPEAVAGAIRASTQALASEIRTELDLVTAQVDTFRVDRDTPWRTPGFVHHEFKLRRGFVTTADSGTFLAVAAKRMRELDDANVRVDLRAYESDITEDLLSIDLEKGFVSVDGYALNGHFVRMTYDAGFAVDTDDEYQGVPNWLKEAAYLSAAISLDANPIIRRDDEAPAQVDELSRQLRAIMSNRVRYAPAAIKTTLAG
jgi:hypothetical protein